MGDGMARWIAELPVWLGRIIAVAAVLLATLAVISEFGVVRRLWLFLPYSLAAERDVRTRAGPLPNSGAFVGPALSATGSELERKASAQLAALPPLPGVNREGVRFAYVPAGLNLPGFGGAAVALSVPFDGTIAHVMVADFNQPHSIQDPGIQHFVIPKATYLRLTDRLDRIIIGWPGVGLRCFDGVATAFERFHSGKVWSGVGNECIDHYAKLRPILAEALKGSPADHLFGP